MVQKNPLPPKKNPPNKPTLEEEDEWMRKAGTALRIHKINRVRKNKKK